MTMDNCSNSTLPLIPKSLSFCIEHDEMHDIHGLILTQSHKEDLISLDFYLQSKIWMYVLLQCDWEAELIELVVECLLECFQSGEGLDNDIIKELIYYYNENRLSLELLSKVLKRSIRSSEGVLTTEDHDGQLLLHYAVSAVNVNSSKSKMLRVVYESNPAAIEHQDRNLELPLHTAIRFFYVQDEIDIDQYQFMLQKYPNGAKIKNKSGLYPLQLLCQKLNDNYIMRDHLPKKFMELLRIIYYAYPRAAVTKIYDEDVDFQNILHFCFSHKGNPPPELIFFLLKKHPKLAFLEDGEGFTALHRITQKICILRIQEYVKKHSNLKDMLSSMHDERNGDNLLHAVSRRNFSPDCFTFRHGGFSCFDYHSYNATSVNQLFEWLLATFPHLSVEKNNDGDLPLHVRLDAKTKISEVDEKSYHSEVVALVRTCDRVYKNKDDLSDLDCPRSKKREPPFLQAATQKKKCLSTVYFLAKRYVVARGGFYF